MTKQCLSSFVLNRINASAANCPNINDVTNVLMPINATALRIAASGSPDSSTISSPWLSVTYCASETGSTGNAVCQQNSIPTWTIGQCYDRVDIQIAYANIGSVSNPQPIIGAVVFHYQRSVSHCLYFFSFSNSLCLDDHQYHITFGIVAFNSNCYISRCIELARHTRRSSAST